MCTQPSQRHRPLTQWYLLWPPEPLRACNFLSTHFLASSSDSGLTGNAPDCHLIALHLCLDSRNSCSSRENHGYACRETSNYRSSTSPFSGSAQHSHPLNQELRAPSSNLCADTRPSISSYPLWPNSYFTGGIMCTATWKCIPSFL